jgi:hypothetical protein
MAKRKTCPKCNIRQLTTAFARCASARDGLYAWCKACKRAYAVGWRKLDYAKKKRESAVTQATHPPPRWKKCLYCKKKLPMQQFSRHLAEPDGRSKCCRGCTLKYNKKYRAANRDKIIALSKAWYASHKDYVRTRSREYRMSLRWSVLSYYSGGGTPHCACCNEATFEFLTIEHLHGDGRAHRARVGAGSMVMWLRQAGLPKGFGVLCYNCNCGTSANHGVCPHKAPWLTIAPKPVPLATKSRTRR